MAESRIKEKEERIRKEKEKREAAILAKEKRLERLAQKAKLEDESPFKKHKSDRTPGKMDGGEPVTPMKDTEDTVKDNSTPVKREVSGNASVKTETETETLNQVEIISTNVFVNKPMDVLVVQSSGMVGTCVPEGVGKLSALDRGEVTPTKQSMVVAKTKQEVDSLEALRARKETLKDISQQKNPAVQKEGVQKDTNEIKVEQKVKEESMEKVCKTECNSSLKGQRVSTESKAADTDESQSVLDNKQASVKCVDMSTLDSGSKVPVVTDSSIRESVSGPLGQSVVSISKVETHEEIIDSKGDRLNSFAPNSQVDSGDISSNMDIN